MAVAPPRRKGVAAAEAAVAAKDRGVRAPEDSVQVLPESLPKVNRQLGTCQASSVTIASSSATCPGIVPTQERMRLAGAAPVELAQVQPPPERPPATTEGEKEEEKDAKRMRRRRKGASPALTPVTPVNPKKGSA